MSSATINWIAFSAGQQIHLEQCDGRTAAYVCIHFSGPEVILEPLSNQWTSCDTGVASNLHEACADAVRAAKVEATWALHEARPASSLSFSTLHLACLEIAQTMCWNQSLQGQNGLCWLSSFLAKPRGDDAQEQIEDQPPVRPLRWAAWVSCRARLV